MAAERYPTSAEVLLKKAVDCENNKNYNEALQLYLEGIQLLINLKEETSIIENYMTRAEALKKFIKENTTNNSLKSHCNVSTNLIMGNEVASSSSVFSHQQIIIESDSTGHSYQSVFGRFLNKQVSEIVVEDPYIRSFHQCQNFLRFCELALKSCENLKRIKLLTTAEKPEQLEWLRLIQSDLSYRFRVQLDIEYSTKLHDREIRLNNGWIIKIGRGLDYFKSENKFAIGYHDMDLRKCHETTVDIFHQNVTKKSYG